MKLLDVPIRTISELKAKPMEILQETSKHKMATYIFNRNKSVGVVLSAALFQELVENDEAQKRRIQELEEKLLDLEIEKIAQERLNEENRQLISAEEVMGENWREGLENIPDEWE